MQKVRKGEIGHFLQKRDFAAFFPKSALFEICGAQAQKQHFGKWYHGIESTILIASTIPISLTLSHFSDFDDFS